MPTLSSLVAPDVTAIYKWHYGITRSSTMTADDLATPVTRASAVMVLLMPWLLVLPGHQQLWYWLYKVNKSLSSITKDFHCPCQPLIRVDRKCKWVRWPDPNIFLNVLITNEWQWIWLRKYWYYIHYDWNLEAGKDALVYENEICIISYYFHYVISTIIIDIALMIMSSVSFMFS